MLHGSCITKDSAKFESNCYFKMSKNLGHYGCINITTHAMKHIQLDLTDFLELWMICNWILFNVRRRNSQTWSSSHREFPSHQAASHKNFLLIWPSHLQISPPNVYTNDFMIVKIFTILVAADPKSNKTSLLLTFTDGNDKDFPHWMNWKTTMKRRWCCSWQDWLWPKRKVMTKTLTIWWRWPW